MKQIKMDFPSSFICTNVLQQDWDGLLLFVCLYACIVTRGFVTLDQSRLSHSATTTSHLDQLTQQHTNIHTHMPLLCWGPLSKKAKRWRKDSPCDQHHPLYLIKMVNTSPPRPPSFCKHLLWPQCLEGGMLFAHWCCGSEKMFKPCRFLFITKRMYCGQSKSKSSEPLNRLHQKNMLWKIKRHHEAQTKKK